MITQNVRIPRWRAVVLCLGGVIAMTKPLTSGVSLYRSSLPSPVTNYSSLYGWVAESGPYNANERWRAEQRLRVIGYPRDRFTEAEVQDAAGTIRVMGLAEVRRHRLEEKERSDRAFGDRLAAGVLIATGAGGMIFYLWLGYALLHEADPARPADARTGWFGRRRRHRRIVFGGEEAYAYPGHGHPPVNCVLPARRYSMYPWSRSSPAPATTSATCSPASPP